MSGFWIFAISLTVAYVIYYGIIISMDLYGKPKEQANGSEETFEFKEMEFETPKAVEETSGGFRISENNGEDGDSGWNETVTRQPETSSSQQEASKLDATGAPLTPAQEKINQAEKSMEDIDVQMNSELMDKTMISAMSEGKPVVVKINKVAAASPDNEKHKQKTNGIDRL